MYATDKILEPKTDEWQLRNWKSKKKKSQLEK